MACFTIYSAKEIGTELGVGVLMGLLVLQNIKFPDAYIPIFFYFLLSYLYPKLSSVNKKTLRSKNFKGFMVFYIPMLIGSLIVVYFGRDIIV